MRPTVTDRQRVVCRSVTVVSPAKTAQPIEMPFGLRTRVDPRNHVLDGGSEPPCEGAILRGRGGHCKVKRFSAISSVTRVQQQLRWATVWPQQTSDEKRGLLCPFTGAGRRAARPHLTQCGLGRDLPPYQSGKVVS